LSRSAHANGILFYLPTHTITSLRFFCMMAGSTLAQHYSNMMLTRVHVLYFNVLQLILDLYTPFQEGHVNVFFIACRHTSHLTNTLLINVLHMRTAHGKWLATIIRYNKFPLLLTVQAWIRSVNMFINKHPDFKWFYYKEILLSQKFIANITNLLQTCSGSNVSPSLLANIGGRV
jgi:hypothetical protein